MQSTRNRFGKSSLTCRRCILPLTSSILFYSSFLYTCRLAIAVLLICRFNTLQYVYFYMLLYKYKASLLLVVFLGFEEK